MTILRSLYALAVMLIPLSYSTKFMLGRPEITWINPTVIIAFVLFFLLWPPIKPGISLYIVISGIVSACLGFLFLSTSGSPGSALYEIAREPVRTALNLIWFWLTIFFIQKDREFVVKWFALSVLIQLVIAVYLLLGTQRLVPLPAAILEYQQDYALRQIVWFGDIPVVRLAGTFIEGPPFGLFMFCGFVIFSIEIFKGHRRTSLTTAGWIAALVGSIGSLATQILVALFIFVAFGVLFSISFRRAKIVRIVSAVIIIVLTPYLAVSLSRKISDADSLQAYDVHGRSGSERLFHTIYGLNLLIDNPRLIPFGVGPGRYGAYVQGVGAFTQSTGIMVMAVDWLIEYGLIGVFLIGWWLWIVGKKAHKTFGLIALVAFISLIMADMFQANWQWESWFTALAYMYAVDSNNPGKPESQKQQSL